MISLEIEEQLLPDTVSRLRLLEATSPPIFEELNATSFKLLGRFMHEWNARRSSALNGGMRDFESYVLAFPTAVGLARLGKLASRLVEFHLRSSKVPDVVAIVTQKDRDVCDAMLDVLRGRLACTHKDDQRSREGILNRLDLLSFIFDLRSIVTLPLHDSSWITGDARHSEQYGLMLDWNCMFEGADRLIGDVSSLRWVPIKDMPVRLEDYSPIVAYLDDAGRQRSSPAPVSVSDDFEVLESHVYDWSYTSRDTRKTAMYVLAARRLPKGAATAPHVYWAPPEWQHTLCSWVRCNMKAPFWTDDGKRTEYNSSSAWCIHIPDAIPDVTLINAVSLEETLIRGGNQCEVDVATWFEGGPTLRWNGSSWNPCKLGRPSYLDSNDSHGKAAIMHLRYPKEVLEAALDQLDDVDDDGHTFVLDGVLDEEGERRLEVEARRSLVEQERILDVFIKW
ncbi:hypothetical protein OE88DRAFT_926786 [Heliocybe sulcata]|uniref:Uncharacterized protein n=1 Tax=Heliocybe sulcata TaxID=5364 RepID=A0A5C3MLX0_9AGAM|nr:hypothetical protein OE88DRAFT_926786 [Heliocybe sulcata]